MYGEIVCILFYTCVCVVHLHLLIIVLHVLIHAGRVRIPSATFTWKSSPEAGLSG